VRAGALWPEKKTPTKNTPPRTEQKTNPPQVRPVGQRQYEWVDLWDAYAAQKVVFVRQAVTEDLANQLM